MKKIIAISTFFIFSITSAIGATLTPTFGISGNMAAYSASGIEREFDGGSQVASNRETGAFATEYASVFVEVGLSENFSIGVDYVPTSFDTPENISNEDQTNQNRVSARFEDLTTLYAKVNVPQLGGTYLKLGFSTVDVLSKESMNSGSTYGNDTSSGMTVGLGYDHEIANGFSIRAEITASEFDDVTAKSNAATASRTQIDISDMIGARGTISIAKSF